MGAMALFFRPVLFSVGNCLFNQSAAANVDSQPPGLYGALEGGWAVVLATGTGCGAPAVHAGDTQH